MARRSRLSGLDDRELIAHYGEVMGEMRRREVVRSGNNPIADIAEKLVAEYYGVE